MTQQNAERLADVISYATGMVIEIGIAGMSWSQSFFSRNASIPLNIISARPFGLFRNVLVRRFAPGQSRLGKAIADLVAFTAFQIPIYALVLSLSGASGTQIIKAISSVIVLFLFMGPPYGLWLDLCRRRTASWAARSV